MKPEHTRRQFGGIAALLGVWWTWSVAVPLITGIWSDGFEVFDAVFLFTIVPLMAIPGLLAIVFGVRLFREMRESYLKWVIGVLAVFFVFFLSSRASEVFPFVLPEGLQDSVLLLISSLIGIGAYLFLVRLLLLHFTRKDYRMGSLPGRGVLILMAWQVWILLSGVFDEYSPIEEGCTQVPEGPWGILGLIVPVGVAYGLYRILARRLTKEQQGGAH